MERISIGLLLIRKYNTFVREASSPCNGNHFLVLLTFVCVCVCMCVCNVCMHVCMHMHVCIIFMEAMTFVKQK